MWNLFELIVYDNLLCEIKIKSNKMCNLEVYS